MSIRKATLAVILFVGFIYFAAALESVNSFTWSKIKVSPLILST